MFVTPFRLGLISRASQIFAASESASYGGKIYFHFECSHLCFTVKQEEVISTFPGCILGSFMWVKPGRFVYLSYWHVPLSHSYF